ncbi:MAG: uroporphyrinogen decarboxylase family protein, partial [Terriglobales bacterium]
ITNTSPSLKICSMRSRSRWPFGKNRIRCSVDYAALLKTLCLKREFGDRLTFWGGGVDTQHALPFGSPDEVRAEVRERLRIFGPSGGYVFNTIHNVQARVPVENVLAMYEEVREFGHYRAMAVP